MNDNIYHVLAAWLPVNSTAAISAEDLNNTNTAGISLSEISSAIFSNTPCTQGVSIIAPDVELGYISGFRDREVSIVGNNGYNVLVWGT